MRRSEIGTERHRSWWLSAFGGSLELAVGSRDAVDYEASLPLGAVRLTTELVKSDPPGRESEALLRSRVREALAPHRDAFLKRGPLRAVAAGGSVRAIARIVDERRARRQPSPDPAPHLPLAELAGLEARLLESTHDERMQMRGMRKRRADLVPAAAVVLTSVAAELGLEAYTICDWGLREGLLLEAIEAEGP